MARSGVVQRLAENNYEVKTQNTSIFLDLIEGMPRCHATHMDVGR
jgi:hypothetical protein